MGAAPILKNPESQDDMEVRAHASGMIYGPFVNSPFGTTIGINLLGTKAKVCSFDCAYCDLGRTTLRLNRLKSDGILPTYEELEAELQTTIMRFHAEGPGFDAFCVSGNGEPTVHPDFPEIARLIMRLRDEWFPGKPVILMSNGASLHTRKIAAAANLFTERVIKIDCGNEKLFKQVNAPLSRANLAHVLSGIRNLTDVIVQSLFFTGEFTNTNPADIEEWIEVIGIVRPKAVHIHGLSRSPATPGLRACDEDTLYAIASMLERRTQIKATVIA